MPDFQSLGITAALNETLRLQGIVQPTPVQKESIPFLLAGRDVIVRARTGTGKTLAFLLPILMKINSERPVPQALIVAPTRELALQITEEAKKMAEGTDIKILAVYGGQDVEKQLRKLEGGRQLIIGTPGRLLDHLRRGTLQLGSVNTLVLDEADQMLHMGFLNEVETLIEALPYRRQTMLFSATMPAEIKRLAGAYTKDAEDITIKGENSPVPIDHIQQQIVEVTDRSKQDALITMINRYRPYLAIIFCRTKRRASTLNAALLEQGYASDELHGDLSQAKREAVMKRFRDAKLQLLVATDVAARGLDVEGVTHVFNYDIPHDVESYIHRIGRTGRAGGKGMAITFVAQRDRGELLRIEQHIRHNIERLRYESGDGFGELVRIGSSSGGKKGRPRSGEGERGQGRGRRESSGGGRPDARSVSGEASARREGRGSGRNKAYTGVADDRSRTRDDRHQGAGRSTRSDSRSDSRSGGRSDSRSAGRSDSRTSGRSDSRSSGRSSFGSSDRQGRGGSAGRSGGRKGRR